MWLRSLRYESSVHTGEGIAMNIYGTLIAEIPGLNEYQICKAHGDHNDGL